MRTCVISSTLTSEYMEKGSVKHSIKTSRVPLAASLNGIPKVDSGEYMAPPARPKTFLNSLIYMISSFEGDGGNLSNMRNSIFSSFGLLQTQHSSFWCSCMPAQGQVQNSGILPVRSV